MPFLAKEHVSLPNKDILSWTFDDLNYNWDEPIYIDALEPERSYTARQAWTTIRKLAAGFQAMGVKQGDCVCIHSFNDISYPIFFLGLIAAGGIFAGTNPAYTQFELEHTLQTAKVKFVIVHPDLAKNMSQAAAANGIPKENVWIFNPKGESAPKGMTQWNDLLQHGEQDWIRFDDYKTSYDTTAARLYSSGTSGLPKATMVSHYNLIAQHTLVYESPPRPYEARRLFALPMFHAATSPVAFTTPLRTGEKAYVLPKFDLENWFWAHQEYKITDLGAVPPIVVMAINSPLAKKYSLKSAKVGTIGAAPLDKHPQARLKALMADGAPVAQVWGMTETSCICTRHPYPQNDDTASVGFPVPNIDVKFVDDDGKDITAYDVRGEICVRGPTIIRGYFENPEANERDWDADGYFHTGDIGFIDGKTGFYYIVDRKKELIKVRGFQVAPPEVEGVLLSHPNIVDCAVIGVPDPVREGGELPRAYVVRRDPQSTEPSEDEVHKYVKERLASFKRLEGGVIFVETIPKNASGKILKRILREQAKDEMSAAKRTLGAKL